MSKRSGRSHGSKLPADEESGINMDSTCAGKMKLQSEKFDRDHAQEENLEKYKSFFENSDLAIFQSTPEGILLTANPALAHMLGYDSVDEALSSMRDISKQMYAQAEERKRVVDQFTDGRESLSTETEFRRKDGSIVQVSLKARAGRDEDGQLLYFEGYVEDITEDKRTAERIFKISRLIKDLLISGTMDEKLKRITDAVVDIFDADFVRIWVVESGDLCESGCIHAKITAGRDACLDRTKCLHLHASSGRYIHLGGSHRRVPLGAYKIGRVATGEMPSFVTNDVTHDPQVHDHKWAERLGLVSFAGFRILSSDGAPIGVLALFSKHVIVPEEEAILEDLAYITSHLIQTGLTDRALHESEKKLRRLYESMADAYASVDMSGHIIEFNEAFRKMTGYTEDELRNLTYRDITPAAWLELEDRIIEEQVLTKGASDLFEKEYVRKDGTIFPAELRTYLIRDDDGNPAGMWAIVRDITERKRAEMELKDSERRLADIINFLPDATFAIDRDGKIIAWNRATEEMTGYKAADMIGKGDHEYGMAFYGHRRPLLIDMVLKPIEEVKNIYECAKLEGNALVAETYTPLIRPGGAYLWFRATPLYGTERKVIGAIESVRDVTDRKLAEQYKMEFYRRTIMAATDGKLLMAEKHEIYQIGGPCIAEYEIASVEDIGKIRMAASEIAILAGMDEPLVHDFAVTIGEAGTNALKHAGGGQASIHRATDSLMFIVSDCGPGIEAMTIPQVAFVKGYTTAGTLGMGYKIIIALAEKVYIATSNVGTTVGIQMELHRHTDVESAAKDFDWAKVKI
ncbi:PAS domain S-box protein [bacterium]|nr:PAS domain S-box protein [bacterium]